MQKRRETQMRRLGWNNATIKDAHVMNLGPGDLSRSYLKEKKKKKC